MQIETVMQSFRDIYNMFEDDLSSKYKFYLRSYSNGENEVVLYAVDNEDNKR